MAMRKGDVGKASSVIKTAVSDNTVERVACVVHVALNCVSSATVDGLRRVFSGVVTKVRR